MLILRYFTFVGGALVALLFIGSYYFPEASVVRSADVAKPAVRVVSDRAGPPRVDFDTNMRIEIASVPVAEVLQQEPTRLVESQASTPPLFTPEVPIKVERKKTRVTKRVDRRRMAAGLQGFQPFHLTW